MGKAQPNAGIFLQVIGKFKLIKKFKILAPSPSKNHKLRKELVFFGENADYEAAFNVGWGSRLDIPVSLFQIVKASFSIISAMIDKANGRKMAMQRNCKGLVKNNFSLYMAMKHNNYVEFMMEDFYDLVDTYFPEDISAEMIQAWNLPSGIDLSGLQSYFDEFATLFYRLNETMHKGLLHERQLMYHCQDEGMEFVNAYLGNAQLTTFSIKRKEFTKKVLNRKAAEAKF